jgi:hypothetical protein
MILDGPSVALRIKIDVPPGVAGCNFFALVGLLRTLTLAVVFTRCPTLRVDCAEAAAGTERATRQKTIANFFNILKISPLVGPGPSDAVSGMADEQREHRGKKNIYAFLQRRSIE